MYLHQLELKNFRIYKDCTIKFNPGLNLIVGGNDAGKSAIIDAIKLLLGTLSNDWTKIDADDFHSAEDNFSICCTFKNFDDKEAALFLEWLSFDEEGNFFLKITLRARSPKGGRPFHTVFAGAEEDSGILQGEAREKLRVTYLKPLRDAEFELTPKRNSRLSQILDSFHPFQNKISHPLVDIMKQANEEIIKYFESGNDGGVVHDAINHDYLKNFSLSHNPLSSRIGISGNNLRSILEKLELRILNKNFNENLGLGSSNLLFIAAEMLLLQRDNDYVGLKLALVEEIEAHLHPQSQLNLIDFLEKQSESLGFQSIITTHSNTLASKIDINKLILCKSGCAYSLHEDYTNLEKGDYEFLRRFLDATKANLFFANGILMVEGDAENLLLPTLAQLIGRPLYKHGVSIVNVSSTALLRYSRIFQRKDGSTIGIPVACITDRDIPPKEAAEHTYVLESGINKGQLKNLIEGKTEANYTDFEITKRENGIKTKYNGGDVQVFFTDTWTLEYEMAKSCIRKYLHMAISQAKASNDLDKEIPENELIELYKQCEKDIKGWVSKGDSINKIAVSIYAPLVRKQASKAVVAQLLSHILTINASSIDLIELQSDPYLKYLIDAIDYVTSKTAND
jgi:putative ATP-dependent endonuclease of OLD family